MATANTGTFLPEVWSQQMLDTYKDTLFNSLLPVRSRGAQLLRDVALGKPEYGPEIGDPPALPYTSDNIHIHDSASYLSPTAGPATWTNNTTAADPPFVAPITTAGV